MWKNPTRTCTQNLSICFYYSRSNCTSCQKKAPGFKLNFTEPYKSNWQVICRDQWSFVLNKWVRSERNEIRSSGRDQSTHNTLPLMLFNLCLTILMLHTAKITNMSPCNIHGLYLRFLFVYAAVLNQNILPWCCW